MRIAIVGGGVTGLTAASRLSQQGYQVVVFEKEKFLGGLAAGFKRRGWDWYAERFFHHFFVSDSSARSLLAELGLESQVFFRRAKTSIFKGGRISQFDSVFSVLRFPFLSWEEKLRTGLVTAFLKLGIIAPQGFEKVTAESWLKRYYGLRAYQILWQPLLQGKFGQLADQVSMFWFWARIKKRSQRLGYLKGGFKILIDQLARKLEQNGGKIITQTEVKGIEVRDWHLEIGGLRFDRVIVTIPTPQFLKIVPSLPSEYKNRLSQLKFVGALNLVLVLRKRFLADDTYWLNINEPGFPFVAVVEHTNFIRPQYYDGNHLLYVGGYYPSKHPYFKMSKEEIFQEFLPYLQKINPHFDFSLFTLHTSLFTNLYAQPVIPVNYSQVIPSMETPVKNLYLANQSLIYPWDRGVNYAIKLGKEVAQQG